MIHTIFKEASLTNDEASFIQSKFQKKMVKKGAILLQENNFVTDQYYVARGCLRTYSLDRAGKEHTLQFAIKDWWISDYIAYFGNQKSVLNIECIQDAELYKLSKEDLESIFKNVPSIEKFFRKKMEKAFVTFQKRILSNLTHTAKERYLNFIHSYPTIEKNIKNYHIASYLGITTESLSRIRKEIASQ